MREFSILFKEIEVADCYFEHEVSLIPLYEDYFTEAGDSEGFFAKLKKAVCDFVDKIVSTINTVFEKFTSGKACKKAEDAIAKNPDLKNEKTKIKDWKKVHVLNKETQKKIQNAKSPEEVDKIMKEYKAKRNKILAIGATVTVTIGGILLFLKKGKSKTVSTMEDQKKGMDYEKSPKVSKPDSIPATKIEETQKAKATADAEIRKTEVRDSADEVKEYMDLLRKDTNDVHDYKDRKEVGDPIETIKKISKNINKLEEYDQNSKLRKDKRISNSAMRCRYTSCKRLLDLVMSDPTLDREKVFKSSKLQELNRRIDKGINKYKNTPSEYDDDDDSSFD